MADLLSPNVDKLVPVSREVRPVRVPEPMPMSAYSAALTQDQQTQTDTLSQVYRGISVVRRSPLPASANPTVHAVANSAVLTINTTTTSTAVLPSEATTSFATTTIAPGANQTGSVGLSHNFTIGNIQ